MAYGDHEAQVLLPGGSRSCRVEEDEFKPPGRKIESGLVLVAALVAVACFAAVATQAGSAGGDVELESTSSKLPQWLQTRPVKLMPLKNLVYLQMRDRELAEGKVEDKLLKEEHPKPAKSPRELAMHTVHFLAKKKAHQEHTVRVHEPVHVHKESEQPVANKEVSAAKATVPQSTNEEVEQAHKAVAAKAAGKGHGESIAAELKIEKTRLVADEHSEIKAEEVVQNEKAEVEKLEHKEEEQPILREKAALKAQIVRAEDAEQKRVANLQKKLSMLEHKNHAAAQVASPVKEAAEAAAPASQVADKKVAAVSKPVVIVHHASAAAQATSKASNIDKVDGMMLKAPSRTQDLSQKPKCTDHNCDVSSEDGKWLASKDSVDRFAQLAQAGSGKAREEALEHMQNLQKEISKDFSHVTSFATAQEQALSPNHGS